MTGYKLPVKWNFTVELHEYTGLRAVFGTGAGEGRTDRLRSPLFSATRKVTERTEDCHVVPGHPPFCDLSVFDSEYCSEIKSRFSA
jgi:hypothetical protein